MPESAKPSRVRFGRSCSPAPSASSTICARVPLRNSLRSAGTLASTQSACCGFIRSSISLPSTRSRKSWKAAESRDPLVCVWRSASGRVKRLAEKYRWPSEIAVYKKFGLAYIPPELREGNDEVERASRNALPRLVTLKDIRGELHAHSTSSDGSHSIAQMAVAAEKHGYDYIGITDHSQSLKIAGGVSIEDLRQQIRLVDKLNERGAFRVLKSAEVDILADGSLDYPDDLLRELDYTVCSIHSRFGLGRQAQTERIMRAMDNRYFNILGHATGRLLLKRPGYEIDMDRAIR